MMTFSIVIPAHNGAEYLLSAIDSAMRQTRPADEILVIDDASLDSTAEIAKASRWVGRVTYCLNEKSTGFADAWNRSAVKARGEYVTILHQDDLLDEDYLYHVERGLLLYPQARHIYTGCRYIDQAGNIMKTTPPPHSLEPVSISGKAYAKRYIQGVFSNQHTHRCPGVSTAKTLLTQDCAYRKEAGLIADDDFFLRVGKHTDVVGISHPLASFRQHSRSATSTLDSLTLQLSRDYVLQAEYYAAGSEVLDDDDIDKLTSLAVKYINLLFYQGTLQRNESWAEEALKLRDTLESIKPGAMRRHVRIWGKPLWRLNSWMGSTGPLVRTYSCLVNLLVLIKTMLTVRKNLSWEK